MVGAAGFCYNDQIQHTPMDSRPPLWKQLLGAVLGAGVALLLYEGYSVASPVLTAWVVAPQSQIRAEHPGAVRVNEQVGEYSFNRMAARAKEIYQRFAAEQAPKAAITRQGIEVTQPLPTSSSSSIAFVDITGLPSSSSSMSSSSETVSSSSEASEEVQIVAVTSTEGYASSASSRATSLSSDGSRAVLAQTEKLAGKKLPSSGLTTTLAAAIAFGAAAGLRRKKRSR